MNVEDLVLDIKFYEEIHDFHYAGYLSRLLGYISETSSEETYNFAVDYQNKVNGMFPEHSKINVL